MTLKSDYGDNSWYLSQWKDNLKTTLSGPKLGEREKVSYTKAAEKKLELTRTFDSAFDLDDMLKYLVEKE
jgi:hypothetical protein